MANLRENAAWESGIYQLETTDPVVGGADGISNKQAIQLANRTGYLKGEIEALKSDASAKLANKRDISDSYSKTQTAALIATKLDSAIAEATYLKKTDKIDAYTKTQSDDKFTQFSHFLSSNAQNGYTKLPNGLIIQWGVDTQVPQGDNTKMTFFPIVFPTACIALTLAHYGAGKEVSAMSYGTPSRTGAIFRHSWPHTPTAVAYIAIGY